MSRYKHIEFTVYDIALVNGLAVKAIEDVLQAPHIRYYIYTMYESDQGSLYVYGYIQSKSARSYTSWMRRVGSKGQVSPLKGCDNHIDLIRKIRKNKERGGNVWEGGIYSPKRGPYLTTNSTFSLWTGDKYIEIPDNIEKKMVNNDIPIMCGGNDAIGSTNMLGDNMSWLEYIADTIKE